MRNEQRERDAEIINYKVERECLEETQDVPVGLVISEMAACRFISRKHLSAYASSGMVGPEGNPRKFDLLFFFFQER